MPRKTQRPKVTVEAKEGDTFGVGTPSWTVVMFRMGNALLPEHWERNSYDFLDFSVLDVDAIQTGTLLFPALYNHLAVRLLLLVLYIDNDCKFKRGNNILRNKELDTGLGVQWDSIDGRPLQVAAPVPDIKRAAKFCPIQLSSIKLVLQSSIFTKSQCCVAPSRIIFVRTQ